jgi:PAS domain S-box-containing protein
MNQPWPGVRPTRWHLLLATAVAYAGASWLTQIYFSNGGRPTIFYLASGIGLAAVLLGGGRFAGAVLLGAFAANIAAEKGIGLALGSAIGSAAAAFTGAWLIRRKPTFDLTLPSLSHVTRMLLLGGAFSSCIGAAVGTTALWFDDKVTIDVFVSNLIDWWMGDTLGVILLTPLILVWWPVASTRSLLPTPQRWAETVLVYGCTALAAGFIFLQWGMETLPMAIRLELSEVAYGYWIFLFVTWAAVRLGRRGTTPVLLLVAVMGAAGILQGKGYFITAVSLTNMAGFWFFTVVLSIVGLTLATYISKSRRIAEALEQSQSSLNKELKNVLTALDQHAIVATTDVQGRITGVNDRFCEISGFSRQELLGQDHRVLNSGAHPTEFFRNLYRTIGSGKTWHGEICNRAKDGHLYWLRTTITPALGDDGKPTSYVAIRADITERKQVEQKLRVSEERLQVATRSGGIGIWEWDLQTNQLIWDDVMLGLYGLKREDFSGAIDAWQCGVHADDLEAELAHLQDAILAVKPFASEFRVVHGDSSVWHLKTSADIVRSADGRALRMVGVCWDISAHKKQEHELTTYRDHLQALVQEKTTGLQSSMEATQRAMRALEQQKFVLDQHAVVTICGVDGLITYGNDRFAELSGYRPDEFLGQDHRIVNSGCHPKGFFKSMYDTINQGQVWHAEVCNRARDGHLYWVDSTVVAFMGEDGTPREYIAVRTDITQRKQIEEAANAANQAKSDFLANMSHEIRTPMNGVIGMVDIMQQTPLLPEQSRMLDTIHSSSVALLGILNDILDFSKIEAGKLELEPIPTHLRDLVEGVTQLLLNIAARKDAQIALFVDPQLPDWMLVDPTRLRQILFNLLGNALKFIDDGDGLAQLHVHLLQRPDGLESVQFRVTDNGIGMSEEVVAKLFQPFTQADASTARKFGGSGLGLSITQRLVEMLQGRIQVHSVPGVGSQFTVDVPLLHAQAPAGRDLPQDPGLTGVQVLTVANTTACSTLLQVYLGAAGAQVTVVSDPASALAMLQDLPAHTVVVLDVPGALGAAAASELVVQWPDAQRVVQLMRRGRTNASVELKAGEVLTLPLFYSDLIRAAARASGRWEAVPDPSPLDNRARVDMATVFGGDAALRSSQKILLAEDNETNRDVMREQLRLLGYSVEMAEDGALALAKWRNGRYALLLTDCHMPNMDGFELTEAIRREEPVGQRLPIIAITANAMQGEAQRCRARGMDDYLAKPLRLQELGPMLAKWMPRSLQDAQGGSALDSAPKPQSEPQESVAPAQSLDTVHWNPGALTALVGDSPALHRRLLVKFLQLALRQVDALEVACRDEDLSAVAQITHALKSAARSVGASLLGQWCDTMESAARRGDGVACSAAQLQVGAEFEAAAAAIRAHLAHVQPPLPEDVP